MVSFNHTASRALAFVLSIVMVMSLVFVPAVQARADAAEGGSVELKLSQQDMDLSAKLFIGQDEPLLALLGSMSFQGEVVADAALYLCAQGLILESNSFLEQPVGINLAQLAENLPNSVFAPDSGSSLALDPVQYEAFMSGFVGGQQAVAAQETAAAQEPAFTEEQMELLNAVGEKYTAMIGELITDNASVSMSPEKVTVGSQVIATSCMTMTLDAEALNTIITQFLAEAEQDESLREAVTLVIGKGMESVPEETAAQLEGVNAADLTDQAWAAIPEMSKSVSEFFEQTGLGASVIVNTSKATNSPIRLEVKLVSGENNVSVVYTMGETFAESEEISLVVLQNDQEFAAIRYQVEENTEARYAGSVFMEQNGDVTAVIALEADKANDCYTVTEALADGTYATFCAKLVQSDAAGVTAEFGMDLVDPEGNEDHYLYRFRWDNTLRRYALSASVNGNDTSLSGVVTEEGSDLLITVDQVDGQPVSGFNLILHGSDSVIVPAYAELLTMSEEEIIDVVNAVAAAMQSVGSAY